jgi:hypothetical protein
MSVFVKVSDDGPIGDAATNTGGCSLAKRFRYRSPRGTEGVRLRKMTLQGNHVPTDESVRGLAKSGQCSVQGRRWNHCTLWRKG